MQPEPSRCEEETPSLLWGLDPVFLAFAKFYIRDILDLKESYQVPGMWLVGLVDAVCCIYTHLKAAESWGLTAFRRAFPATGFENDLAQTFE